jgi:arylsulfatase A-like enzyme
MSASTTLRNGLLRIAYPVALGIVGGGFVALAEFIVMSAPADTRVTPTDLLPYTVFYAIIWGAVGLGVGVLLTLFATARRRPPSVVADAPLAAALVVPAVVFGGLGAYANVELLPRMLSWRSLLFDAVLLVGCVLLGRAILRAARRRAAASTHAPGRPRPLLIAALGLVAVLIAGFLLPSDQVADAGAPGGETPRDVNVLLLVVDALRADHLGCYGYERDTSPNIDRLAREGVLFENAYAQAPLTKLSTATLVTGLLPSSHGVLGIPDALPEGTPILMEEMRKLGYRTAVLSANQLVSPLFGFARGSDFTFSGSRPTSFKSLQGRTIRALSLRVPGLGWIPPALTAIDMALPRSGEPLSISKEQAGTLNAKLLSWIGGAPDARFFAYVHYMEPHMPLVPPAPFDTRFQPDRRGRIWFDFPGYDRGLLPFHPGPPLPDARLADLIAQYDATIAYFDHELGRLLDALDERGIAGNTLVVITSDHGEEFYDHKGWGHGTSLYEELIRVPLIVWCPEHVPAGARIEDLVRHVDIMPTLLRAAGAGDDLHHGELDGRNLWTALAEDGEMGPEVPVFAEYALYPEVILALRVGSEKLIHVSSRGRERVMLFDLATDPGEMNDLSAERPEARNALVAQATDIQRQAASRRRVTKKRTLDEATKETLRALGYIQ